MARAKRSLVMSMLIAGSVIAAGPALGEENAGAPERFARLALACVHQEYPNKLAHVLQSDADAKPPRALTPAFFGCYDWHSAVHAHWLLARLAKNHRTAREPWAQEALAALERSLTPANIAGELAYMQGPGRTSFERPYGLAWLLALHGELADWRDPFSRGVRPFAPATAMAEALDPLAREAATRLKTWLPKLRTPVRVGEHAQTAFALGRAHDWASRTVRHGTRFLPQAFGPEDAALRDLIVERATTYYAKDVDCPLAYEPGGEDFLSPCLAEADLMRRILSLDAYRVWLGGFLPQIPADGSTGWLPVAIVTDRADPKLAHLDGLNLSRAWMLEGMAAGLPGDDPRRASLLATAQAHADAALPHVTGEHYEGGHWLGTFAIYHVTRAGIGAGSGR
jgi:hypothetical protein